MKIRIGDRLEHDFDAVIIPFTEEKKLSVSLPENLREPVEAAAAGGKLSTGCGSVYSLNLFENGRFLRVVLVQLGDGSGTNRDIFLAFAKAFKSCKEAKAAVTAVLLDNAAEITKDHEIIKKICELPFLVSYQFNAYKSVPVVNGMEECVFVTGRDKEEREALRMLMEEAENVAESTMFARDLVNHPSKYMTPSRLAEEAKTMAEKLGLEAEIFDKAAAKEMKMGAFLAVARGAVEEPKVIVLRYRGGKEGDSPVALVGKGVMFDSGGYSLKSKMATMHDDMGGAAAVIGAIGAIAKQKLPVNVIAVVSACENMVSGDAYVPGDILSSMNGKTIEMLNADAEGRLTLADSITYAIRKEGAECIIDIATLTGAAKGAVGSRSAAVIANDEELFEEIKEASRVSCEKIWRLPADKELFEVLRSEVADIKNSSPGNVMGGGAIVAGLFIQEFTEGKPWVHVDMAPVNWLAEGNSYSIKGGTGYGVSLLYEMVKLMIKD